MQQTYMIKQLNANKWENSSVKIKLDLLKQIQKNIDYYFNELIEIDCQIKNLNIKDKKNAQQIGTTILSTISPIANNVNGCIDLYKLLIKNKVPKFLDIKLVQNDLYDDQILLDKLKNKIFFDYNKADLRTKNYPKQINPLKKKGGIVAILGAGNFNSPFEIIRALFIDNCVAIYKAHPINKNSISVWKKILKPLIEYKALIFYNVNQGKDLIQNNKLKKIYFTGNSQTAKKILELTSTELVAECGGNNPCIIVPGNKPWTKKEIIYNAKLIATFAKMNGGAVCARTQTVITCKNWKQREIFLQELEIAIQEKTTPTSSFYPGTNQKFKKFQQNYPNALLIKNKQNTIPNSDFLLIKNIQNNNFALQQEAFCQIIGEVALDTKPQTNEFLKAAVNFSNTKLFGSLACSILIDKETQKNDSDSLDKAITNLNYGNISINTMPLYIWLNPYLTWGASKHESQFESGSGDFGNLMCTINVEKSIIHSQFCSNKYLSNMNKPGWLKLSTLLARYTIKPSLYRLFKLFLSALIN